MDPDKLTKTAIIAVALPIVIVGIGLMLGLSGWRIAIAVIIIPVIILAVWIKPSFLQFQQLNQNQPSRFSRLLTWAKKDPLSAFVFSIALLVIVYGVFSYLQDNLTGTEKALTFASQAEFQQNFDQVSGNWQVSVNCLRGSGEFQLKNSENLKWRKIKISPCEKEFSDATIKVGNYNFNFWVYEDSRSSLYGAVAKKYFAGNIRYGTMELDPVGGRVETFGNAPVPVTVISDKSFVYPKSPDLKMWAGDTRVVSSRSYLAEYAGAPADSPVQGIISFYFDRNAGISKIEIY